MLAFCETDRNRNHVLKTRRSVQSESSPFVKCRFFLFVAKFVHQKGLGLRGSSKALDDPAKIPVTDFFSSFHPKPHISMHSIHSMHLFIIVYHCVSLFIIFRRRQELHRTAKVGRMQCLRSRFDAELLIVPSAPSAPYRPAHVEDLLGVAQ